MKIMNIGIDISQIVYQGSGVSRFTKGLINSILQHDKTNKWTFFFSGLRRRIDSILIEKIKDKGFSIIQYPFPLSLLSFLVNDMRNTTKFLTENSPNFKKLDWFITSDWIEPPMPCKKATIIHDLVFRVYPDTVDKTIVAAQANRLIHVERESELIFTDSRSTATDLMTMYDIDKNRVVVNYPGVSKNEQLTSLSTLDKFWIKKPYILSVGKIEPRKNIPRLIKAYKLAFGKSKDKPALVIVGPYGWGELAESDDPKIIITGFVTDRDLVALYRNAKFFIYPSLYEGFGYPIIEAMHYGCPVAASSTSSLSEIGGKAVYTFNPTSTEDISKTLINMNQDSALRRKLSTIGIDHAQSFSWKKYYQTLIRSLNDSSSN
ncbi:hypothetical protein COV58_04410 [Candidatus Roizmanbacteria bacterium CG11_big_fil_rev_8_21_14_0_20_36_8]|uniref:Glycosyl transferase family 1 domain-containing protein n=1 Tax=Candidatus Roizmanbacteria bacterium CG11_big_fil_rev_8_21_14_0_20_36_8 TaxID=1974856 RepID=A0A2M6IT19_9BACT|nr:MAG: hypothetical protein COV58_04410 [Candidatus Roizmanbacteria bacterium CG11_big_fil_rev_8_21_14_0_20_36_8]